ncbi:MAG: pilus assembly protein [Chloroflexota bacterium]|nr:pilus assembly protein [Chloroflexota bacterium]
MVLSRARRQPPSGLGHQHRGQALIEMAMVVMILLTLVGGIFDFSIYMYRYVQASNCVREAARRAVVRADDAANPPYCVDADLAPTLSPSDYKSLDAGEEVNASIDTVHNWFVIDQFIPVLGPSVPLTASTSMRMEGQIAT